MKVDHPLSDDAILKLISDKSFIGCCGAGARCFHNNFTKNQLCIEEIDANAAIKANSNLNLNQKYNCLKLNKTPIFWTRKKI